MIAQNGVHYLLYITEKMQAYTHCRAFGSSSHGSSRGMEAYIMYFAANSTSRFAITHADPAIVRAWI